MRRVQTSIRWARPATLARTFCRFGTFRFFVLLLALLTLLPTSGRFPQMPFEESMGKYGNDKPDLRFDMPHTDVTGLVVDHAAGGVPFWKDIADKFASGKYRRDLPPGMAEQMRRSLTKVVLLNLLITMVVPLIDKAAHIGGLITGILLASLTESAAALPARL